MPPAFSDTRNTGGPASSWNSRTTAARSRVDPSRRAKRMPTWQVRLDQESSSDVHCEKTSALCPSDDGVLERLERAARPSTTSRRAARGRAPRDRPPGEGAAALRARRGRRRPRRDLLGDALAGRDADGVVDAALGFVELDVRAPASVRERQLGQHVALGATEHEGPNLGAQPRGRLGVAAAMGLAYRSWKSLTPPSRPGFAKCIALQSSSSRFSTGVPLSATRNLPRSSNAARAVWLPRFLMAWASSSTTTSHSSARAAPRPGAGRAYVVSVTSAEASSSRFGPW